MRVSSSEAAVNYRHTPVVTGLHVVPVAGHDSMLTNISEQSRHLPYEAVREALGPESGPDSEGLDRDSDAKLDRARDGRPRDSVSGVAFRAMNA
jgi:hypothetical protein